MAHVHSEWSDDASWPLGRIARAFGRRGYAVVLMCEHSRGFTAAKWHEYVQACEAASSRRVTLVPGIEYGDGDDVVHIPVWGRVPFFGEAPRTGALLGEVSEAGGTAVWAHPWRRDAWQRFDPSWNSHLSAVEVWNRKYDGIAPNRRSLELTRRDGARPFVALDFHTRRQLFPLSLSLRLDTSATQDLDGSGGQDLTSSAAQDLDSSAGHDGARAPHPVITADEVYAALQAGRFTARALGVAVERLTSGLPAATLRTLESGRQLAARLVR